MGDKTRNNKIGRYSLNTRGQQNKKEYWCNFGSPTSGKHLSYLRT